MRLLGIYTWSDSREGEVFHAYVHTGTFYTGFAALDSDEARRSVLYWSSFIWRAIGNDNHWGSPHDQALTYKVPAQYCMSEQFLWQWNDKAFSKYMGV